MDELDQRRGIDVLTSAIVRGMRRQSTRRGRSRLPPLAMMYVDTWSTNATSLCRRSRMR